MSASLRVQAKIKPGHKTAASSVPAPTATTSALFALFILKSFNYIFVHCVFIQDYKFQFKYYFREYLDYCLRIELALL